jgi:Na+/H+-dicarboxylate symporter
MPHPLEEITLEPLRRLSHTLERLVEGRLWLKVLIGMGLGVLLGILLGPSVGLVPVMAAATLVGWLALPGTLFIALVQMIVVPLVFASVVRGLTSSDSPAQLRELGIAGGIFFVATTALATAIGLGLALLIEPGRFIDPASASQVLGSAQAAAGSSAGALPSLSELPDLITGLLPTNPLASMVGGDMVRVILFAVVIGVALVGLPAEKSGPLFDLLGSLQEVCMKVVSGAMRLAPFAVFGLMTRLTAALGIEALAGMAVYVLTVLLGMALMLVLHHVIAWAIAGRSPLGFAKAIREVVLLAFSTSSSAAVMPLSIQTAEDKLGIRPAIARFLIPLGATVNMNGTALYQGAATVFLAQVFNVDLSGAALLLVVVMAVAASIGSPATPGTGIVILSMILEGAGIPAAGIGLLLGVDRVLDMSRTAVNVTGDLTACAVLERFIATARAADAPTAQPLGTP